MDLVEEKEENTQSTCEEYQDEESEALFLKAKDSSDLEKSGEGSAAVLFLADSIVGYRFQKEQASPIHPTSFYLNYWQQNSLDNSSSSSSMFNPILWPHARYECCIYFYGGFSSISSL